MVNELGIGLYAPVWGGLLGTLILMANWIESKSRTLFEEYVDRVSECNADLGMDLSVDPSAIAMDLIIPWRARNIRKYAKNHGMDEQRYTAKIAQCAGRPVMLLLLLVPYLTALMTAFAGPAIYHWTGLSLTAEYFTILLGFTAATLLVYFFA